MAQDIERLVVQLSADIKKYENAMSRASGITNQRTRKIESDFQKMNRGITSQFMVLGKAATAGLAGIGIAGLAAGFAEAAKSVAELGDQAKIAGVSVEAFQEWRYVAEQARIPIDAITDGLKELSLRADEFAVTGKGSAAEAFQRLGLSPQEVQERLKNPSEFLLLLIERTRQLKDTAAGVRIFDELFGGQGGERMVALIEQGETGIRSQIKAANDLGVVIDAQLVQRAAELDAKFNTIVHTVGQNLKAAVVSAADSLVDFIDLWRDMENRQTSTLNSQQISVDKQRLDLENKILETQNNSLLSTQNRTKAVGQLKLQLEGLTKQSGDIAGELYKRLPATPKVEDRTFTPITPPSPEAKSARDKAVREAERERQAVTDLIAELDHEYSLIGMTAAQQAKMNALRQAGSAATSAEQLAITTKIDAIYREQEAVDSVADATRAAADAGRDFAGTLIDGFLDGASAAETLGNALKNLGSRLIDSGLNSLFNPTSGGDFLGRIHKIRS